MARVNVEDCLDKVESNFDLVLVAFERAKQLHSGMQVTNSKGNAKTHLSALRDISEGTVDTNELRESFKHSLVDKNKNVFAKQDEEPKKGKQQTISDMSELSFITDDVEMSKD